MTTPTPARTGRPLAHSETVAPSRLPSNQVVMDPAVADRVISGAIDEIAVAVQKAALFGGEIEKSFKRILDHTKAAQVASAQVAASTAAVGKASKPASQVRQSTPTGAVNPALHDTDVAYGPAQPAPRHSTGTHGRVTTSDLLAGDQGLLPGRDRPIIDALPGDRGWDTREHSLGHMKFGDAAKTSQDWGSLRQHGAQRLNQYLSSRTPAAPYHVDEEGNLFHLRPDGSKGRRVASRDLPGATQEMESYTRGLNRMANVQGAVNAVGQGEGLSGALGAVGTKLGWVGAAVGVAKMTVGQFTNQREKNAYYQQIYGGSNAGAFKQRASEAAFTRFSMLGTMSGEQAKQLYQGVSEIGIQGDERSGALDFAVRNYRRTGLDTKTSVEIVRAAVENGVHEFTELGTQLDLVAKAARSAGINVGEAQKAFAQTYQMVNANIVSGQGAAAVAGGLQAAQSSLGTGAVSSLSLAQMAGDPTNQKKQATALGMSPLTYTARLATGGTEANRLQASGMEAQLRQASQTALSAAARARLNELVQQGHPAENSADFKDLSDQLMAEGLLNPLAAQATLAGYTGQNISQAAAGSVAVAASLGAYSTAIKNTLGTSVGTPTNKTGKMNQASQTRDDAYSHNAWFGHESNHSIAAYSDREKKTGVTDSFVNRLAHEKNADKMRVRVTDANGQTKEVSIADAIKNDAYYAQITSGKVQVKADKNAEAESITDRFQREDSERERNKKTGGNKDGRIEIYAKPELERLLGFNYYGGADATAARAAGVPAAPGGDPVTATGQP